MLPGLRIGRITRAVTVCAALVSVTAGYGAACLVKPRSGEAWFAFFFGSMIAYLLLRQLWGRVFWQKLFRSLSRQFERALDLGDRPRAERITRRIAAILAATPHGRDAVRLSLLSLFAEFDDAASIETLLSRIDLAALPARLLPYAQNNVAWARVRIGDADALPLAESALTGWSEDFGPKAMVVSTVGAALHVAGRHAEAIERLDEAIAAGGSPRALACHRYMRGSALVALARDDDARTMFEEAIRDAPRSMWAVKARECLATMRPFRR